MPAIAVLLNIITHAKETALTFASLQLQVVLCGLSSAAQAHLAALDATLARVKQLARDTTTSFFAGLDTPSGAPAPAALSPTQLMCVAVKDHAGDDLGLIET